MSIDYKQSGVDIDAGNEAVRRIKASVKETHDLNVITDIGTFGAMYDVFFLKEYRNPVLVQSTDSVGTKVKVADMAGRYESVGRDIVGHSCGDILSMGARPVTFLDYLAFEHVCPEHVEEVVRGIASACREANVSLIGGEVAELPGVYEKGEFDVVGTITGVVEKEKIITGEKIREGDAVLGLASSGLHTNGYSLARKLFFDLGDLSVDSVIPEIGRSLGDVLLEPHRNYTRVILGLLDAGCDIRGLAHITGGGFLENIPRILPDGLGTRIQKGTWQVFPIFDVMQKIGDVSESEMFRTFNMGIGMVIIVSSEEVQNIKEKCGEFGEEVFEIGRVVVGEKSVWLI